MKAILRAGAGILVLFTAGSVCFGYVLVTPVYKQPYPQAPSICTTAGVYYIDAWGRISGPYYFLTPPCQPFNGCLPGKTGQAIMAGNLPHTLLLSKEGLAIGKVPMVGQKQEAGTPDHGQGQPHPGAGLPELGGPPGAYMQFAGPSSLGYAVPPQPHMQIPYGYAPNMQPPQGPMYPPAGPSMQVPYPVQAPVGSIPARAMPVSMPYPMQPMYGPMPYPMYGPMRYPMQPTYAPPPMAMPRMPMTYYPMSNSGIAQAQGVAPGAQPFMPIPGFGVPSAPPPPAPPGMNPGPQENFQLFQPLQQSDRLQPLNPLQPMGPQMGPLAPLETMQLPRMDYAPPPPQKLGGAAYPTHPFVRSPRDFFMWGESMEDEIRMRRRPFPVP